MNGRRLLLLKKWSVSSGVLLIYVKIWRDASIQINRNSKRSSLVPNMFEWRISGRQEVPQGSRAVCCMLKQIVPWSQRALWTWVKNCGNPETFTICVIHDHFS